MSEANTKSTEELIRSKGLNAPRITPEEVEAEIQGETYTVLPSGKVMVCELTLTNGYTVRGEAATVSKENFNEEIGRKISRENAVEKIWELEGYLLQERLYAKKLQDTQDLKEWREKKTFATMGTGAASYIGYKNTQVQYMRPYEPREDVSKISISKEDREKGAPREGDQIAINPNNLEDQWLVARDFFMENYEPAE